MVGIKIFADDSLSSLEEYSNLWLQENPLIEILHTNFQTKGPRNTEYALIITYKYPF